MQSIVISLAITAGIGAMFVFWAISLYNGLVIMRNQYRNSFSQIDVQLKRRHDLIPNLVETAKGYMNHERDTLEAVIHARNQASSAREAVAGGNPAAVADMNRAESNLNSAMSRFMMLQESYPDLKANTTMAGLTTELAATENRIAFAREAYNDSVLEYNNRREMFPSSVLANAFSFTPAQLFEIRSEAEREQVKVSFSQA